MSEKSVQIEKVIDVEKVIASKNKNLLKWLPGFVIRYLKRIIHQDFINQFLHDHRNDFGLDFVKAILTDFGVEVSWEGEEHLQNADRLIVASNHPLGGLDGIALMHVAGQFRKDILFPVNDLLMNLPNLKELFIPVNKHGSNVENARIIDQSFESKVTMLYFPAGLVSRKHGKHIRDLEWKKTFIRKARDHHRNVIPTFISGKNSNWFYGLANFRKRFGIKANLEMLYLVDEMVKQRGNKIHIKFGSAIDYQIFDRTKKDQEWAEIVKQKAYALGQS